MAETPVTSPRDAQLDAVTRTVLAIREACEAALLQLHAMRGQPVAPSAPPPAAPAPAARPAMVPRPRETRVYGKSDPYVHGAPPAALSEPAVPLDGPAVRALIDGVAAAGAGAGAGAAAVLDAVPADEAGSSDASARSTPASLA